MLHNPAAESVDESAAPTDEASQWETPDGIADPDTPSQTSPEPQDGNDDAAQRVHVPMQKRRRVTRACDECRRKKIKCDGKQPCTHCTVYSYECTYDQPSNRRRNAAPQYIESLEKRLKRMESLLGMVLPNVDLEDPNLEAMIRQGSVRYDPHQIRHAPLSAAAASGHAPAAHPEGASESQLESMMKSTGQLDLDEDGYWDYHGHSSGISFIHHIREQFPDIIHEPRNPSGFMKTRPLSQVFESPTFESPKNNMDSPVEIHSPVFNADLPPREIAREFLDMAINDAAALLRIVHAPSIWKSFDRIYDTPPESYTNEDNKFLPLLYSMLALGSLFTKEGRSIDVKGYESAIDQGFKYFRAARHLMDIADCRDLKALQSILFMILFLQSSAKLSTCYSYIGVALRSALRMGLHRNFDANFNPIEREERKRVFWIIRKMDTYVGALLGLPHTMSDDDIDQEFPTPVDDEYITETEILPMPPGKVSVTEAANAHALLVAIVAKIVKYVYPLKKKDQPSGGGKTLNSYTVSYAKIREIELELQEWMQKLPMGLKPGGDAPEVIIRVQQLLRMAYAHAQMMLYRPFLHYVSHTCKSKVIDKRSYACAAACVSVSRNIIHIVTEMKRRGLLCGAYWFTMYTCFFAILSLVFFALENPDNQTSQEVLRDAREGKEALADLAKRSMAADRCTATLNVIFDQLPEKLKDSRRESMSGKRRRKEPATASQSSTSDESKAFTPPKLSDAPRKFRPSGTPAMNAKANVKPYFPAHSALRNDSPFSHSSPASSYGEPSSAVSVGSSSVAPLPFATQGGPTYPQVATLSNNSWNAMSLSPSVVTSFSDANMPLPDLTSMMFPSSDPFAYPNQSSVGYIPNDDFDDKGFGLGAYNVGDASDGSRGANNIDGHMNDAGIDGADANGFVPPSSTFLPRDTNNGDLDVQLFGPLPMYQMQGIKNAGSSMDFSGAFASAVGGMGPDQGSKQGNTGDQSGNPIAGMNLDVLFGGEEWAGMFADGRGVAGGMNSNIRF